MSLRVILWCHLDWLDRLEFRQIRRESDVGGRRECYSSGTYTRAVVLGTYGSVHTPLYMYVVCQTVRRSVVAGQPRGARARYGAIQVAGPVPHISFASLPSQAKFWILSDVCQATHQLSYTQSPAQCQSPS